MKRFLKKIFINKLYLFGILPLIITSCNEDDILKEKPLDFLSPENAYTTTLGIKQGINGLYTEIRSNMTNPDGGFGVVWNGSGTDVSGSGDVGNVYFLSDYTVGLQPESKLADQLWTYSYRLIQKANMLISAIEKTDASIWKNEEQKRAYSGEVKFFRAYAYRNLVVMFGDVPLVTEPIVSQKTDFVRNPKEDIWKLIEDDLKYAAENLPKRGKQESVGRICNGAAWHYLSEAYLNQSKYQLAVDAASKIIDGGDYALMRNRFGNTNDVFGTGDVFLDLFAYGNQLIPENKETLFVIQYEPNVEGGSRYPGSRVWGSAYWRLDKTPDGYKAFLGKKYNGKYTGLNDTLGRGTSFIKPTYFAHHIIWESDWDNDIRNAKHAIYREFRYDNPESAYHGKLIDFSKYKPGTRDLEQDTAYHIYPFFLKWADPCHYFTDPARFGGGYVHKDIYEARLAETYLIRAEAYFGLKNNQKAADDINAIRTRANAKPITAEDVTIDYILDERARELYAEEDRHITLRRNNKFVERVKKYNDNPRFPGLNVKEHHNLWPIPQQQIDLNLDAVIEQNPGY